MYEQVHLRAHHDRIARAELALRRQWSRPPRPPSPSRRALARVLRAAADALAPAPGHQPRRV